MNPAAFTRSLDQDNPPAGLSIALKALWWIHKEDLETAHELVMNESGADCAWVHAHLHRMEGDLDNAGYWYRQAGRKPATGAFTVERDAMVATLLGPERT